jgi:hypothetical protein
VYAPVAGEGPAGPEMVVSDAGVLTGKVDVIVYVCEGEKKGVVNDEVPSGFVEMDGVTCACRIGKESIHQLIYPLRLLMPYCAEMISIQ